MVRTFIIPPLVIFAAALAGCAAPDAEGSDTPRHEHEREQGSCEAAGQVQSTKVEKRTTPSGGSLVHVGAELAGAPVAAVADILARPGEFDGKTVQVSGHVSAMCTHRRAWFAVVADDQSGRQMRVTTAPAFLVPEDSIGMTARVEGTIETEEISRERADYLARDHKLSYPDGDGPIRQPVMRATGANFE